MRTISFAVALAASVTGCFAVPSGYQMGANGRVYLDPRFDRTKTDLDNAVTQFTKDYATEGEPVSGQLQSFQPLPLTLKRGKCYVMVLRLADGAKFSGHARRGVSFIYTGIAGSDQVNGGPGITGPGGVGSAGCPQADAPEARFDLQMIPDSAGDKTLVHELGTGAFSLQLYSKPVSEEDLARMKGNQEREIAEAKEFGREEERKHRERASATCAKCAQERTDCIADWRRGATKQTCENEYSSCLFRGSVNSARECP